MRIQPKFVITYALLGGAAVTALMLPESLSIRQSEASGPATITLMGVVRDFKSSHSDFAVIPADGWGHCAGLVELTRSGNVPPAFAGAASGWSGPSGGGGGSGDILVVTSASLTGSANWDTYDSSIGAYGGGNDGGTPNFVTGSTMPTLLPPTGLPPKVGTVNGSGTISSDIHCDQFIIKNENVTISGDVTIYAEVKFDIYDQSRVTISPGSSLTVYAEGSIRIKDSDVGGGSSADPEMFTLYNLGTSNVNIVDQCNYVYANIISPGAKMYVKDSNFYGGFIGLTAHIDDQGDGHFDTAFSYSSGGSSTPTSGGFRVDAQWETGATDPIAPHMYLDGSGAAAPNEVYLAGSPTIQGSPTVDSFDSSLGAYGGANVGPAPTMQTGQTMPTVTTPSVSPSMALWKQDSGGTFIINSSFTCGTFELGNSTTVRIQNDVIIVATDLFKVHNFGEILLDPGATLEIYAAKDFYVQDSSEVNVNTADPTRCTIYLTGTVEGYLQNDAHLYCTFVAPNTYLDVKNGADFYGRYTGDDLTVQDTAGFHIDTGGGGGAVDSCGNTLSDTAGTAGSATAAAISSGPSFDEWYSDVPAVNLSAVHPITLTDNGSGVYEYTEPSFFPIDDKLLGNESASHNFYFTYSIEADFAYQACAGQFFEIAGQDDLWVFVGDELVIDLGGMRADQRQIIELDRVSGLVDGETYRLSLFFAQRQGTSSSFTLSTNVGLTQDGVIPLVSDQYD